MSQVRKRAHHVLFLGCVVMSLFGKDDIFDWQTETRKVFIACRDLVGC